MNALGAMDPGSNQRFLRLIKMFAVFLAITANLTCERKTAHPAEPPENVFPPLTDTIPYEKLGQGKLVFERLGPQENNYSGVYVIDLNNRSSWGIGSGVFDAAAVSPNGQKIAFTRLASYPADTLFDVHIMDINGLNIQNISFIQGQDGSPSWMPDSRQVLFWVGNPEPSLYRQSPVPNPADRTLIRAFVYEGTRVWTLEGPVSVSQDSKLAFTAHFSLSPSGIYTMDLDGSNLRRIASVDIDGASLLSPAWSPDGQKIAYLKYLRDSAKEFASLEVVVINANGSNPQQLAKFETAKVTGFYAGQNDISLCWCPDGSKIAFNKKEEGNLISHIYVINSDGSGLAQVTFAEGVTDRSLSWSN